MRLALTLLLALAAAPCAAQPHVEGAKSLVADALKDDWGYAFLEGLTTEIGQRLAGTEAQARAAEWAAAKLKSAGFDEVHIESFPMTAWVRGVESGRIVAPAPQHLVLTALGGSVATPAERDRSRNRAVPQLRRADWRRRRARSPARSPS